MNHEPTYGPLAVNYMDTCKYVTIVVSQTIFFNVMYHWFFSIQYSLWKASKKGTHERKKKPWNRKEDRGLWLWNLLISLDFVANTELLSIGSSGKLVKWRGLWQSLNNILLSLLVERTVLVWSQGYPSMM